MTETANSFLARAQRQVVLAVENGHLMAGQTAEAVKRLFRPYRAKRR